MLNPSYGPSGMDTPRHFSQETSGTTTILSTQYSKPCGNTQINVMSYNKANVIGEMADKEFLSKNFQYKIEN